MTMKQKSKDDGDLAISVEEVRKLNHDDEKGWMKER
jgi:hypothetical protein